jgi:SSS family solute:Na+ symporter
MFNEIASSDLRAMLEAPGLGADGEPWSWAEYSSAVIVSALGFSMWPHLFMKSYAARSERTLRLTVVLYPTFQLFLVPILLIGFAGVLAYPNVSPADTIVPYLLTQIDLSPIVVGLVCAGTLAASMSSGDAILHAAASIGLRDGLRPLLRTAMSDHRERLWIRVLVILTSIVAYYFAVVSDVSIVALLLGAYGGVAQIFPLMFAAFFWPRANGAGAIAGLLAGIGANTLFLVAPELKPFPLHEGVYGVLANVAALVAVSLVTAPEPADRVRTYMEAGTPLEVEA